MTWKSAKMGIASYPTIVLGCVVCLMAGGACAGTTTLVRQEETTTTFRLQASTTVFREKPLPVGTASYADYAITVQDGASGKNTDVEILTCFQTGAYGGSWKTTGISHLSTNGNTRTYRVKLENVNPPQWHGGGQFGCRFRVKVSNNRTPKVSSKISAIYNTNGSVRGAVSVTSQHTMTSAPGGSYTTVGILGDGIAAGNYAEQWTALGIPVNTDTTVNKEAVNVTINYADSIKGTVGGDKHELFRITGAGTGAIQWKWSYQGDSRKFSVVNNGGNEVSPNINTGVNGAIFLRPLPNSTEWGVKQGNLTLEFSVQ